jgi:hypothetical protein
VSGRSGRSPWPGHGCLQELGRSTRACAREHADEKEECRSSMHGRAGPAWRKGGRIPYRLWASSQGIAEASRVPGRVRGRAVGAARGKMRRSGAEAAECGRSNCRPAGARQRIRRGIQRHAHGGGAAGEQRARGGTGMSARACARTLEGVGEGHHVEASGRA